MNHEISLATAVDMTKTYRNNRESILKIGTSKDVLPICETFDKKAIQKLLDEEGCASFRIYYGMDEQLNIHAILVAADAEGRDILPQEQSESGNDPVVILEDGQRCPYYCPPASALNGE